MEDQGLRWQRVRLPFPRLRWWRYLIPFRAPFSTAHGQLEAREGVLIALETIDGRTGWGEIAPLPAFGGSVNEALACLERAAKRMFGPTFAADAPPSLEATTIEAALPGARASRPPSWDLPGRCRTMQAQAPRAGETPALPACLSAVASWLDALLPDAVSSAASSAVRCGLETAVLDLLGQAAGCSIARLLAQEPAMTIPVNATIGAADTARAVEQAAAAAGAGYGAAKLKVGMLPDVAAEAARVAAVRAALGPAVRLRLDANGGWGVDEAVAVLRACAPFDLEYVEQPTAADDIEGLAAVRQAGVPIAADEAVTGPAAVERLLALRAADVLVLKPMALGGALATWDLAERARARGVGVVVTSLLEAGGGIAAAAQLAAALTPPLRACGLATAGLLEHDLLATPLRIDGGVLHLPAGPGLGVVVDQAALRRHAAAEGGWERRP